MGLGAGRASPSPLGFLREGVPVGLSFCLDSSCFGQKDREHIMKEEKKKPVMQTEWDRRLKVLNSVNTEVLGNCPFKRGIRVGE